MVVQGVEVESTTGTWLSVVFAFALITAGQVAAARLGIEQEAKRRWQHAVTGHCLVLASYLFPVTLSVVALLVGAAAMYYTRFYHKDLFLRLFGPLLRENEKQDHTMPGAFYFLLGTALTAACFPLSTARYAVECLALADPMAAWVGRSVKSPRINHSASVAGSFACFASAWIIGCLYLYDNQEEETKATLATVSWQRITLGAMACCLVEALPVGNDNLLIPIVTAAAAHFGAPSDDSIG